jgi:site-specific DNA-methyltransferase (adenine-specific)
MDLMARYPDNYFELAIVDPPYGIDIAKSGKVGGGKCAKATEYKPSEWDSKTPNKSYFKELQRVSKNQIIWGGNYMIEHLKNTPCFLIWDKNNTGNFADAELAWSSFSSPTRIFKSTWNGMIQHDMKNKEKRIHPTQKPTRLYEWLLMNYAKEGDKILDTHLGSGSIAIACHNLGFDLTACELDTEYYNAAMKRLKQHQAQQTLF